MHSDAFASVVEFFAIDPGGYLDRQGPASSGEENIHLFGFPY